MSAPPDYHFGDSDGEDGLSNLEPHDQVTDQDVAEVSKKKTV